MGRHYFFGSYNSFRPLIKVVNSGSDSQFTIPTFTSTYVYDYNLRTSDGQYFTSLAGDKIIIFPLANTDYTIEITGLFPQWRQNNNAESVKVKAILSQGDIVMGANQITAYWGCSDMVAGLDYKPNYTGAVSANSTYYLCAKFNPQNYAPNLGSLIDGGQMYRGCTLFNPPLYNPSYQNLTSGANMYRDCKAFNPPLYNPTLKSLTLANAMYFNCTSFTRDFIQDDPINGTVNLSNIGGMFDGIKSEVIRMQAGSVTTTTPTTFRCTLLKTLILIQMKISFFIIYSPLLTGTKIDDLANSVASMVGFASPTVSMTVAQKASCNNALWTAKNWTIAT